MDTNHEKFQGIQTDIMRLLVSKTLQKYGADSKRKPLSEQERRQLKETIHSLKEQTESLLENLQKQVSENDPAVMNSATGAKAAQPPLGLNRRQMPDIQFRKRNRKK